MKPDSLSLYSSRLNNMVRISMTKTTPIYQHTLAYNMNYYTEILTM